MARKCQVCGQPATVRVEANLNGRHSTMLLCDDHYRRLVSLSREPSSSLLRRSPCYGIYSLKTAS